MKKHFKEGFLCPFGNIVILKLISGSQGCDILEKETLTHNLSKGFINGRIRHPFEKGIRGFKTLEKADVFIGVSFAILVFYLILPLEP